MSKPIKVLLIEDDPGDIRLIQKMLAGSDDPKFDLEYATQLNTGLETFNKKDIDTLLLDLSLPDSTGFDTFNIAHNQKPEVPIVVITGINDEELAVKVIRGGAQDYLVKWQIDGDLLAKAIFYAIERKDSEKKLVEYSSQLKAMVETSLDGIALANLDSKLVYVNKAFADSHGYSQEEMNDLEIAKLHSPEQAVLSHEVVNLIKTKGSWAGELEHYRKDGQPFPTYMSTSLIRNDDGKPTGMLAICRDITEQKLLEGELRDSKETLRNILESSPDSIIVTDLDGNLIDCNPATVQLHGFNNKEEILGRNSLEFISPADRQRAVKNLKKTIEKGSIRNVEYSFLRKGGIEFKGEFSANLIKDNDNNPTALVSVCKDISDRKKTEESLKKSEEKWRSLVQNAPNIIMIVDREGKILFINHTVRGLEKAMVLGKTIYDYIESSYHQVVKKTIADVFLTGESGFYEIKGTGPGGEKAWYHTLVSPITHNNKVVAATQITYDETESKNAQSQIMESLQQKEVLLREIHHRVKNNLQVISSLFRLQSAVAKDKQVQEILKETRNRIDTMGLIHEKLYQSDDLTKINFPKYLRSLTTQLFCSNQISTDQIRLNINIDEINLGVDTANCLGLIINELLSNSLKHAFPQGRKGKIYIEFRESTMESESTHKTASTKIEIVISDNGVGLPHGLSFESSSTLGFQVVTSLVEQLNGSLELYPHFYSATNNSIESHKSWLDNIQSSNVPGTTFIITFIKPRYTTGKT